MHEQKSDASAQSMACCKLIGAVDHVLALTGTIIGGYANHLYPLMMRITPQTLRDEGFEWGKDLAFAKIYGRIDRIVTTTEEDPSPTRAGQRQVHAAGQERQPLGERKSVRPGVMPTMFGRHMIGTSHVHHPGGAGRRAARPVRVRRRPLGARARRPTRTDDAGFATAQQDGWFDVACDMEPDQKAEYDRVAAIMEFANKELLKRGCMKFLGAMLWTCWTTPTGRSAGATTPRSRRRSTQGTSETVAAGDRRLRPGSRSATRSGYWDKPGSKKLDNWVGVVTPKDLRPRT